MRKVVISLFAIFFVFISCTNKNRDVEPIFPESLKVAIDESIHEILVQTGVPGVIAGVWIDKQGSYTTAVGLSNVADSEPMETGFHFRVGSVTKTFTAIAVLQLVDENLIALDEPIQTYLPEKNIPRGDEITIRMLGNMTSGLFSYSFDSIFQVEFIDNPEKQWSPDSLLERAFCHPNLFDPGTEYFYCNTNTIILGLLVEKITDKLIMQVFEEKIFNPLSLNNTVWPVDLTIPSPYSNGYTNQTIDGQVVNATHWSPSWAFTAGQLISNIFDLRANIESISEGTLISTKMLKEQQTWYNMPVKGKYGFGIAMVNGWLGHNGSIPGYNTAMYRNNEEGVTIIVGVNSDIHQGNELEPANQFFQGIAEVITPENTPFGN